MTKNEQFSMLCDQINDLHIRKNSDYGDSFGELFEKFGITSAIIRLHDKMKRIEQLTMTGKQHVSDESIRDTLLDLASYSLMTVIELDSRTERGIQK